MNSLRWCAGWGAAAALVALVVACGDDTAYRNARDGGDAVDGGVVDSGPVPDSAPPPATDSGPAPTLPSFAVGGTVAGLLGTGLVLDDNAVDPLPVAASGPFTFPTKLVQGAAFWVTVKTQPASPAQTCTVSGAMGNVHTADVSNVTVNCTAATAFTIGGTVSGLASGEAVVLQNNGADNLTLNANGSFTFVAPINIGAPYSVTVLTQPVGQTCTVTNGTGTVAAANVTNVTLVCASL
jgi:hypothetical protein